MHRIAPQLFCLIPKKLGSWEVYLILFNIILLDSSILSFILPEGLIEYKQQVPIKITVHHEGGKVLSKTDDAKQRLKNIQTWGMGPDRKWADVPYHLLIATDGTVYQGRNPLTVGETNTEYDPTGHLLICFLGNYSQQKLDRRLRKVLVNLLADQCIKYNIAANEISTHRDHSSQTTCPGEEIYSYFKSGYMVKEVTIALKKRRFI